MKIQINISVRNQVVLKDDDYKEEWIAINGDKITKYSPAVSFLIDADVQKYIKAEIDGYTFKVSITGQSPKPFREVFVDQLDVTEFIHSEVSTPVILSKSILNNIMAAQNEGKGKLYWYYFIKEDADYVQVESNIWLSRSHFDILNQSGHVNS